jgi:RNA polymerase sigma factor (sigma-70 family)
MVAHDEINASSLWEQFLLDGSESSFETLVRRHIDLVYSVALRRCAGDATLAKDAVQVVFSDLANKARRLPRNLVLGGWLYRHTSFVASNLVRAESRRRARESRAMEPSGPDTEVRWDQLGPVLDDALHELQEADRDALVLRYFERGSFRDIGSALGVSADAARMRVDRALDRLKERLQHRGITSTAAALGLVIGEHGIVAAPAGLISTIETTALVASATGTSHLVTLMASTKMHLTLAAVVAAGATTFAIRERRNADDLRAQMASMEAARTTASLPSGTGNPVSVQPAELEELRNDRIKLMALRDEVGRLRDDLRRSKQLEKEKAVPRIEKEPETQEDLEKAQRQFEQEMDRALGMARLDFAKSWMMAIYEYAQNHDGRAPESFAEAQPHLPKDDNPRGAMLDPARFEIVHRGPLKDLARPEMTIVLREREPFLSPPDESGRRVARRTYGFADGHSEIHAAPDGDFESWESARRAP